MWRRRRRHYNDNINMKTKLSLTVIALLFLTVIAFYAFVSSNPVPDEFDMMCEFESSSADVLEFSINKRPVASTTSARFFSEVGNYSEYFKAGSNVLSIAVIEKNKADITKDKPHLTKENEYARVKILLTRSVGEETIEEIVIMDEKFNPIPPEFHFTIPDLWPIKSFVWEGETPDITEKDKTEILGILQSVADAYASISDKKSVEKLWQLEKFRNEYISSLCGIPILEMREIADKDASMYAKRYGGETPVFKDLKIRPIAGLNLVKISVENEKPEYGTAPLVTHSKDGSGSLVGPEWFSKIDGKWWIVP